MAYSELIKNFERIRSYMKEFYIYGFKTRDEFNKKSGRSYDNQKRRIESYLGDYMGFRQRAEGKNIFLSIDSRSVRPNPLYKALKAKSFTDGDITLHFILLDILYSPQVSLPICDITDRIDREYLRSFQSPIVFDESTVRKKLKEYCEIGLIKSEKRGRQVYYSRTDSVDLSAWDNAIRFFSEVGGCGVIGNFLLDKTDNVSQHFSFKHHYITHALESEVLCNLFIAIGQKRAVTITYQAHRARREESINVVPLKIFVSAQNGRQYLFGYNTRAQRVKCYRLDYISGVKPGEVAENYSQLQSLLEQMRRHMWGTSLGKGKKPEHVEFTIHIDDDEEHIYRRLLREKRCGTVTRIDKNNCRFAADVYDTGEMVPWIRTFICRITYLNFSNRTIENQFKRDVEQMYRLYGVGGEE